MVNHEVCLCDNCHCDSVERIAEALIDGQITQDEFRQSMGHLRDRRLKRKEQEQLSNEKDT